MGMLDFVTETQASVYMDVLKAGTIPHVWSSVIANVGEKHVTLTMASVQRDACRDTRETIVAY